jgi:hypothetical protein
MGVFLLEATKYAEKAADGRATEADRRKLKRAAWRTTSHLIPNPFGIAGGLRREAGSTERYPNVSPGWLGFLWDPEAEWNLQEGVTSPSYREGKIERREKRAEKLERERERGCDNGNHEPKSCRSWRCHPVGGMRWVHPRSLYGGARPLPCDLQGGVCGNVPVYVEVRAGSHSSASPTAASSSAPSATAAPSAPTGAMREGE